MADFAADGTAFRSMARDVASDAVIAVPVGGAVASPLPAPAADPVAVTDQRRLPSFFIVGPPRTGSTWLHELLSQHTQLPSPSKETRFFDTHYHRGLNWYLAHYDADDAKRRMGEVAPTYFASSEARERIALVAPAAKIACVFRHPVERLVSLYRLKRAYGMIRWTLEEAIERDPELMESSNYAGNFRLWQRCFGDDNVWAGTYDDLRQHPQSFMNSLTDFIGIPRFAIAPGEYARVHDSECMTLPRSYYRTRTALIMADRFKAWRLNRIVVALKNSRLRKLILGGGTPFSQPEPEVLAWLYERLRPEVEALEVLLERDLSAWKTPKAASKGPRVPAGVESLAA
jgi:hypothetical protein